MMLIKKKSERIGKLVEKENSIKKNFFYWNELIYNVVLVSAVEQSESIIHIHISILFLFRFFPHIGHYRVLSTVPCSIQ